MGRTMLDLDYKISDDYRHIVELAAKHSLTLESDTEALIKHIIRGGHVEGIEKLISKSWCLNQAVQFWATLTKQGILNSTTQRAFEFICELAGHAGQEGKQKASALVDVIIEGIGARRPVE